MWGEEGAGESNHVEPIQCSRFCHTALMLTSQHTLAALLRPIFFSANLDFIFCRQPSVICCQQCVCSRGSARFMFLSLCQLLHQALSAAATRNVAFAYCHSWSPTLLF